MLGDCPRVLTLEQMTERLKAGQTLRVDRIDAPELFELCELEAHGLVASEMIHVDEQYSYAKFWWIGEK